VAPGAVGLAVLGAAAGELAVVAASSASRLALPAPQAVMAKAKTERAVAALKRGAEDRVESFTFPEWSGRQRQTSHFLIFPYASGLASRHNDG